MAKCEPAILRLRELDAVLGQKANVEGLVSLADPKAGVVLWDTPHSEPKPSVRLSPGAPLDGTTRRASVDYLEKQAIAQLLRKGLDAYDLSVDQPKRRKTAGLSADGPDPATWALMAEKLAPDQQTRPRQVFWVHDGKRVLTVLFSEHGGRLHVLHIQRHDAAR